MSGQNNKVERLPEKMISFPTKESVADFSHGHILFNDLFKCLHFFLNR